ncbi:hypothetical protein B9T26_02500 [Acinetobacter sp. ANC 4169]|uniref:hypothetical protein n=1 Tax=Acinetobacter sp. ANC 4169 TaxID=1977879 RepID=UPI000A34BE17|nr:hypothetical protein [Acinetobacter sp. ANC 4169]OTG76694.1 hypothetical protein B9T26_02500 [Acinetobacter sp. ANC 4169]
MKKMLLAITTLMMGCPAFAATATSSIPMSVEIAKQCTIADVPSGLILKEDNTWTTENFSVTCNVPYGIYTTSDKWDAGQTYSYVSNANNNWLKTQITIQNAQTGTGLPLRYPMVYLPQPGYIKADYSLSMRVSDSITATTPAGLYTDVFHVYVEY